MGLREGRLHSHLPTDKQQSEEAYVAIASCSTLFLWVPIDIREVAVVHIPQVLRPAMMEGWRVAKWVSILTANSA